jgi:putative NIF3 family GTP cyclohydrolase 1 type 2
MDYLTRRATLGALMAAGLAPGAMAQTGRSPTAREVFAAIKTASKQSWDPNPTDDRIIYGDPATPITGIATCFFAPLETLQAAKAAGLNYIIPHEATFYERYDDFAESVIPDNNPTLAAKLKFIRDNRMVIQRMHGHAHSMAGDFITTGLVDKLGWTPYRLEPARPVACRIPTASAMAVGRHIKTALGRKTLRMFGNPDQPVSTLTISSGMPGENAQIAQMEFPGVDAVLLGEVREPEVLGYAQDLAARRPIVVYLSGHTGEDFGMRLIAEWAQGVFPQMPVKWLPTTDPYSNPV